MTESRCKPLRCGGLPWMFDIRSCHSPSSTKIWLSGVPLSTQDAFITLQSLTLSSSYSYWVYKSSLIWWVTSLDSSTWWLSRGQGIHSCIVCSDISVRVQTIRIQLLRPGWIPVYEGHISSLSQVPTGSARKQASSLNKRAGSMGSLGSSKNSKFACQAFPSPFASRVCTDCEVKNLHRAWGLWRRSRSITEPEVYETGLPCF